jgi:hypothetical protein
MPGDGEAWRRTLRWLDCDASEVEPGCAFAILDRDAQIDLLERIYAREQWHGLPAAKVWSLWAGYACAAFFSHPLAGNDTGGDGTAYPKGNKVVGRERDHEHGDDGPP